MGWFIITLTFEQIMTSYLRIKKCAMIFVPTTHFRRKGTENVRLVCQKCATRKNVLLNKGRRASKKILTWQTTVRSRSPFCGRLWSFSSRWNIFWPCSLMKMHIGPMPDDDLDDFLFFDSFWNSLTLNGPLLGDSFTGLFFPLGTGSMPESLSILRHRNFNSRNYNVFRCDVFWSEPGLIGLAPEFGQRCSLSQDD